MNKIIKKKMHIGWSDYYKGKDKRYSWKKLRSLLKRILRKDNE